MRDVSGWMITLKHVSMKISLIHKIRPTSKVWRQEMNRQQLAVLITAKLHCNNYDKSMCVTCEQKILKVQRF